MNFDQVIVRCLVEMDIVDSFVDALLAYPEQELMVTSYEVQTHHQNLEDIREKVSGFKQQMAFEITIQLDEAAQLKAYLQSKFSEMAMETQVLPLLKI